MSDQTQANYPVIPLRGITVFPHTIFSFDIGRKKSLKALEHAAEANQLVFLIPQKQADTQEPTLDDLFPIGVVVEIKQFYKASSDTLRVIGEGRCRARIVALDDHGDMLLAEVQELQDSPASESGEDVYYPKALIRSVKNLFETLAEMHPHINSDIIHTILDEKEPGKLADLITANTHTEFETKQALLEELDPYKRLDMVLPLLKDEIEIITLQRKIYDKVKTSVEQTQKEYYLKEQMKAIQEELDGEEDIQSEVISYKEAVKALKLEKTYEQKLLKEVARLPKMGATSSEAAVIRNYLDWVLDLPWNHKTKETTQIQKAEKIINSQHYGLEKVKERVLDYLAVQMTNAPVDTPVLCLVGPPGSGKTSIASSIAQCLNREYVRMSLGGIRDEAEIRGHRKTYIGAMPGRIISALKQAGSKNPLILFDEIDKLSKDFRGDPASALLEVLDTAQNHSFRDHYIEIPFDLSGVLFVCTANSLQPIPPALLDRLEVVELSGYTEDEKLNIFKSFLYPKQLKKHGLKKSQLKFDDDAISHMVNYYTKEAGVRQLERHLAAICRKSVRLLLEGKSKRITVYPQSLQDYLGLPKYHRDKQENTAEIGAAKGLAWTGYGGDTLSIEVNVMKGSGKFELTGNMGNVMKESARAAISFIRSQASDLSIREKFYKDTDIHIHIPEGAVPKDGPSAGITMAAAMVSALTQRPVSGDIAMTGEITIRGNVLPVGGLKEKILAGKRNGVKTIIVPSDNKPDIADIPEDAKNGLNFLYVSHMQEVLEKALLVGHDNTGAH